MAKRLIDVFSEDFFKELKQARNYPTAYEIATQKFEEKHGFQAYESYDSFRRKKKKARD